MLMDMGIPIPIIMDRFSTLETDGFAVYSTVNYAMTDRLSMTAGIRYTKEKKKIIRDNVLLAEISTFYGMPDPYWVEAQSRVDEDNDTWSSITPKLGIDYRLTDDIFLYASITQGYKGGGYDGDANDDTEESPAYDEETIMSYEVGAKTEWLASRLRINTSLYYYDYSDMQIKSYTEDAAGWHNYIDNAGKSTIYGAELEIMARPLPGLSLGSSFAYIHGEYDEYMGMDVTETNLVDMSGNTLAMAPERMINCFISYTIPVKNYGFINLYGDYNWKDEVYGDARNTEKFKIDSYALMNAQISYETADGRWHFDLYGKNLADKIYHTSNSEFPVPYATEDTVFVNWNSDRRTFGVRVGYRF